MVEKIVAKVIGKGLVKRKSEDDGDLEIKQNFILDDLVDIFREKMSEVIFQELEVKGGYEFEIVLKTKQLSKKGYKNQLENDEEWLDQINRPEPRSIGVLLIDGLHDEPQFVGDLPFVFSQEDMDTFVNISKESETPIKINAFHDIESIDQEEFDAHLHMHEHNKMNRSRSDEERVDYMRESMANESKEPWTCEMCHDEQEEGTPFYITQYGTACLSCFESFMGINEEEEEDDDNVEKENIKSTKLN
jgi:hypothetical protein